MASDADLETSVRSGPRKQEVWLRALFMLLFVLVYGVAEAVVVVVALVQFGWLVIAEDRNPRLERFARSLSAFVYEIVAFWTFVSDEKPFPFADWPEAERLRSSGQENLS